MSFENDSIIQGFCSLCYKVPDSDSVTVNEDILLFLNILAVNLDTSSLQNSLLCRICLGKISAAYKFKISLKHSERKTHNVEIKKGSTHTCYTCKKRAEQIFAISLMDAYIGDVINTLIPEQFQGLDMLDNLQICYTCRISMLNIHSILQLLVSYCDRKANHPQSVTVINEYQYDDKLTIKYEPIIETADNIGNEIKVKTNNRTELFIKDKTEENEEVQIKQEELDLKIDVEEQPLTEGFEEDQYQGTHEDDLNKNIKIVKCQICEYQTNHQSDFRSHMLVHKNVSDMFSCHYCEFETNHKCSLKRHMLIHKNVSETEIFRCHQCEFQTKHKLSLKRHKVIHKDATEIKIVKCFHCKFQSNYKCSLKRHNILVHKNVNRSDIFVCYQCEFQTKFKQDLKNHMEIHKDLSETDVFRCHQCEYQTKLKHSLKSHTLIHKDLWEIDVFRCFKCEFQTKHKFSLKRHILIHKDVSRTEIAKCHHCEFRSNYKCSLKRHILIHKDVNETEMFRCFKCKFQTKYKLSLKRHILIHKDVSQLEILKCQQCEFHTNYKWSLKRHILIHKVIS